MQTSCILRATGLTKQFPENGVIAVSSVSVEIHGGAVTGLVGDNGAGKSTLMHLLTGALAPDRGTMFLRGEPVTFASPKEALRAGVVMLHQVPQFAPSLRVWENVILGAEPRTRWGLIDRANARRQVARVAGPGMASLVDRRISQLSSGERRIAGLLPALLRLPAPGAPPGVLVLDEPTAACSAEETVMISDAMRRAAEAGHAVVLVSHKLDHVSAAADRVLIMRAGKLVRDVAGPVTPEVLAHHLLTRTGDAPPGVGAALKRASDPTPGTVGRRRAAQLQPNLPARLVVDGLGGEHAAGRLVSVSFSVATGEIAAVTGARDQGILLLEELLSGAVRPASGRVLMDGVDVTRSAPADRRRAGMGYVPTDRFERGTSIEASVTENLMVLERQQLDRLGFLDRAHVRTYAEQLLARYAIAARPEAPLTELSGGNAQKVVLSREIAQQPRVLIVCEPSWGLDLDSKALVYNELRHLADSGTAILVLTTELDEVIELADRVVVLQDGVAALDRPVGQSSLVEIERIAAGIPARSGGAQ